MFLQNKNLVSLRAIFLVNIIYLRLIWWLCKSAKDVYFI